MSPHEFDAVIFDLDGVITQTATLHARAWKQTFDEYFERRAEQRGERQPPFDIDTDYRRYVDGKPRHEGVRSFLAARGIVLPEGDPSDGPEAETVHGLGRRKDALFMDRMRRVGVEVFASTIRLIHALREQGVKTAVVTSSRNGRELLRAAGIEDLFDMRLDGIDAEALKLEGKPNPAPFLKCAELLGVAPGRAVVVEDAVAGVEAGRRGGFGLVVGVDRGGNRDALAAHGADLVVADLAEVSVADLDAGLREKRETITAWQIEQEGFDPAREHEMESIFTVGNGYLGVRGTLDSPLPGSQGDLFIAGVYDRKHPERPYSELEFLTAGRGDYPYSELVSAPFPFRLRLTADGYPLDLAGPYWRAYRRVLDLRRGTLHSHGAFETDAGRRTVVRTRRCASLADLHLLLQEVSVCLENYSGTVEVDASLADPDLAANHPHLISLETGEVDPACDVQRFTTQASAIELCLAARTTLVGSGEDAVRWQVPGTIGETLTFRRYVVVYTSRDGADPLGAATERLRALRWEDFDDLLEAHAARWGEVWDRAGVRITGSPATAQALRFNAYHLTSAADRDPRVSVGARALTGRAYEGHVFWDVEIFKLPFYTHTCPEVARSLLAYRYHTLDGARRRAQELGQRGACYAWESTVTGDDVTPRTIRLKTTGKEIPIFTGTQQVHVTAGVAHGVWRYWEATRDREFLRDAGVEILAETARFWASRSTRGSQHFHIRTVVGPDEYHHSVDDNAYTNWMARFNLERAVEAVEWMKREFPRAWGSLAERLALTPSEPQEWATVARELYCPAPNSQGVIEQFAGFFDLEDYPLPREERFRAPISRLFDWDRINRLKLIKQADVLMLLHLFPEAFPREVVAANYRYYEPITDHGSSLSPGIHAAIAARLGLREDAERYWRESLWLDLSNTMGNSALGVHPACMGATWQALVFGFLGVRFTETGPMPDPAAGARLSAKWRAVALKLAWRGRLHPIEAAREDVQ
ncbi:MAG: beta-phosphoglucomutase family hydrolase [Thermodesulfobacteriota bacterium]|jgi:beta-phosphoglucomutase family hydrolase